MKQRTTPANRWLRLSVACAGMMGWLLVSGCNGSLEDQKPKQDSGKLAGSTPEATAGQIEDETKLDANQELIRKLQPGVDAQEASQVDKVERSAPTPEKAKTAIAEAKPSVQAPAVELTAAEKKIVAESGEFSKTFAADLVRGDAEALAKHFITMDDLKAISTSGGFQVLSKMGVGYEGARTRLGDLSKALRGQPHDPIWSAGNLHRTPTRNNIWSQTIPMLVDAMLTLHVGETPLLIQLEQVLYIGGRWKILRLK